MSWRTSIAAALVAFAVGVLLWKAGNTGEERGTGAGRELAGRQPPAERDERNRSETRQNVRSALASKLRALSHSVSENDRYDQLQLNEDKLARTPEEHAAAGMTTFGLYASGQFSGWFSLASALRRHDLGLAEEAAALGKKCAVAGRPYPKTELVSLQAEERAMLQRLRAVPNLPQTVTAGMERLANSMEAMADGRGPSVAARLEQEAQQPMKFHRREDDDGDKGEED